MEQFGTTDHPINVPQWPHRVCVGPAWLDRVGKKLSVNEYLLIYNNCVWTVLEFGYYNKQ